MGCERDGEVVGIALSTNGRSCEAHECCGTALRVEDIVRFRIIMLGVE
jgi:hypothetical protein